MDVQGQRSVILDVTAVRLSDDTAWRDNAVTESVRRILDELDQSAESISGWSSYLPDGDT